jgi:DNA-binding XRE family transcriptional regulator
MAIHNISNTVRTVCVVLRELLRKQQNITQVQLAELLGVSQQTINAYEVGRRRMPISTLPPIARCPCVSVEELIGEPAGPAAKKRGPTPKIQQQSH